MFGVAESDESRSYAAFRSKCLRRPRKDEKRFAAFFFSNVDVAPAHGLADPGAERFCHRFFSSETSSQMARRKFHRHRIFNFTLGKNAMQKTISKSVNRTLNARALDKIDANTDHAHFARWSERRRIVGQALRLPGRTRATEAVALQFCGNVRHSCGILRHGTEHFFHSGFQSDPHRARDDGVTNVELGQRRNLVDERDIFVIDAVAGIDLEI
jgi:hypothetical protein